jgi:hypothetical protein
MPKITAAQRRELLAMMVRDTREGAKFHGDYLADILDGKQGEADPVACAVARYVSVLVRLRTYAQSGHLTADVVQAAIDGFMEGAKVRASSGPMGEELFTRGKRDA